MAHLQLEAPWEQLVSDLHCLLYGRHSLSTEIGRDKSRRESPAYQEADEQANKVRDSSTEEELLDVARKWHQLAEQAEHGG
jgi:hypothetical protein